ncbi:hypothetical protein A2U01_0062055, partial [Trifolium medium]|nr:hypothetical protein [Trifolium medium]
MLSDGIVGRVIGDNGEGGWEIIWSSGVMV